jgi:hypothetical protein
MRAGIAGIGDQRGKPRAVQLYLLAILVAKYALLGVFVTTP